MINRSKAAAAETAAVNKGEIQRVTQVQPQRALGTAQDKAAIAVPDCEVGAAAAAAIITTRTYRTAWQGSLCIVKVKKRHCNI
jgi:hypothetical protein